VGNWDDVGLIGDIVCPKESLRKCLILAFWPFNLGVDFGRARERETGKMKVGEDVLDVLGDSTKLIGDFEESPERVDMAESEALACLDWLNVWSEGAPPEFERCW
jgi:hypothetical protein